MRRDTQSRRLRAGRLAASGVTVALAMAVTGQGRAQVAELDTSHSVFYEAPTRTHMFVYSPSVDAAASPWRWLDVRAGWEADVVSGASVSTKAGPSYATNHADVVSTASVHDFRNLGRGEVAIKGDTTTLTGGYAYGTEHDYRSNSLHVNARTDAYQHNTQFELSYAHNFDKVCNRVQSANASLPSEWVALEDSVGCFTSAAGRTTDDIAIDTYEASWAQSWTPIFETQVTYTAQLVDGFQSDPYRSVILGEGLKAQEHVPNDRAREAVTGRAALYLRSIKAALRLNLRGYHDTWAIDSGAAELEFEKSLGENLRAMVRGRLYKQSGAVFWSDDYTGGAPPLGPRGQYFTGDRELSPFWSWLGGARVVWTILPQGRRLLGFLQSFKLSGSFNAEGFSYDQYTLGGVPVTNAIAYVGTASLSLGF
ncbi:MAG TPA: DUF3570 domain-containing protein [Polyangiaceae bacterium]